MKPPKTLFACQECGAQSPKWLGRCPECGAWNSFVEERAEAPAAPAANRYATPLRVPVTAIYSKRDGIVAWRACIDRWSPQVRHIEVSETHIGLGFAPRVLGLVADEIEQA